MKFCHSRGFIDRESYIAQYLTLSIFIVGIVSALGSDDLLAVFAAGTSSPVTTMSQYSHILGSAISWDGDFNIQTEGEAFASIIDLVLNCGCFIYIGAWLPFSQFRADDLGVTPVRLVLLTIGILFLRRIPAILCLYRWVPEISDWREALFSGHFG